MEEEEEGQEKKTYIEQSASKRGAGTHVNVDKKHQHQRDGDDGADVVGSKRSLVAQEENAQSGKRNKSILPQFKSTSSGEAKTFTGRKALPSFSSASSSLSNPERGQDGELAHAAVAKRAFEHVDGNWPTFVYTSVVVPEEAFALAKKLLQSRVDENRIITRIERPHLSWTRTFAFREHEIDPFQREIESIARRASPFEAICRGLRLYYSENRTRLFVSYVVRQGTQAARNLLNSIDQIVGEYGKPQYHENPEFHVSLLWVANDPSRPKVNQGAADETDFVFPIRIQSVETISGNRWKRFELGGKL